ncbi:MAG: SGNH/GDSL hydrolase family protein [Asticcacaulis sp.]
MSISSHLMKTAFFMAAIAGLTPDLAMAQAMPATDGHYIDGTYQRLTVPMIMRANPKSSAKDCDKACPADHLQYQWPGTYFVGAFDGSEVVIKLNDTQNILNITVDDQPPVVLTRPGDIEYRLTSLAPGKHTIRLEVVTEYQGALDDKEGFYGFYVPKNAMPLPVPVSPHQIEFIGDSYTVGYGNMSPETKCTQDEIWATTNTKLAFGPLTAQHFKADYQINAISGRGIVRNFNGGGGRVLPVVYPYSVIMEPDSEHPLPVVARSETWHPQIIVIGLGTNDFSTPLRGAEQWKTRDELHADYEAYYVAFVKSLRSKNPEAFFILMATDGMQGEVQSEVSKIIAHLRADGETRLDFIPMNGLSFGGCNSHPTTADDAKVAQSLIRFIEAKPDLWQDKP